MAPITTIFKMGPNTTIGPMDATMQLFRTRTMRVSALLTKYPRLHAVFSTWTRFSEELFRKWPASEGELIARHLRLMSTLRKEVAQPREMGPHRAKAWEKRLTEWIDAHGLNQEERAERRRRLMESVEERTAKLLGDMSTTRNEVETGEEFEMTEGETTKDEMAEDEIVEGETRE